MHKVDEVNIKCLLPEVLANHLEDGPFQNECIVDGHHADAVHAIPTGLAAAGDARIHYVIGNEEVCLELFCAGSYLSRRAVAGKGKEETYPFDGPAEDGCLEVLRVRKLAALEDSDRVDDAQTAVKLSTRDIVVHTLGWTMDTLGRQRN